MWWVLRSSNIHGGKAIFQFIAHDNITVIRKNPWFKDVNICCIVMGCVAKCFLTHRVLIYCVMCLFSSFSCCLLATVKLCDWHSPCDCSFSRNSRTYGLLSSSPLKLFSVICGLYLEGCIQLPLFCQVHCNRICYKKYYHEDHKLKIIFTVVPCILTLSKFYYQLLYKRIVLKGVLKFTLKELQHMSV